MVEKRKQAGAELCQAQGKLRLAEIIFVLYHYPPPSPSHPWLVLLIQASHNSLHPPYLHRLFRKMSCSFCLISPAINILEGWNIIYLKGLVLYVWFGRSGQVGLVWQVWLGLVISFGLVGQVLIGRFDLFGFVWFGLVKEDDFKRPQVPLKVAKAKLELQLGTIPGRSGSVRFGSVQQ